MPKEEVYYCHKCEIKVKVRSKDNHSPALFCQKCNEAMHNLRGEIEEDSNIVQSLVSELLG